jgi:putative transposase
MPRRRRLDLPGIPQHVVQRGNNRGACFFSDGDRFAYLDRLAHYAKRLAVEVHAYVLMTHHVHLLATPQRHGAISTLMQDLGRDYVRLVNSAHRRTGTLWEGRFHSCLVDTDRYLLTCMRYIELNPVRAGMVQDAADYIWSSHRSNALERVGAVLKPHAVYLALGGTAPERCAAYRDLFASLPDPDEENALRLHTRQGAAWGSAGFQREIAAALGRAVTASPPGRPRRTPLNGI